jgi:gluconate 5-dehydrogenase
MSVRGKVALVTGANRGLGLAIAKALLRGGARVMALARDPAKTPDMERELALVGDDFRTVIADVTDEDAVTRAIGGAERLDIVVNNAGIARAKPLLDTSTDELREILDINVTGAFIVTREAARRMVEEGGGHIVNIASDAAVRGIPGMAPYVASKHALLGMGRSVSLELRQRGVRVTTLCPGPITTDILGPGTANPDALSPDALGDTVVHIAGLPPTVDIQELLVQPLTQDG